MTSLFNGVIIGNSTKLALHQKDVIHFISCDHHSMTFKTYLASLKDPRKDNIKHRTKVSQMIYRFVHALSTQRS